MPRQPKLSKNRRIELKYYCKQYDEKKAEIRSFSYITASNYSGMPGSGKISNTTADNAMRLVHLSREIDIIEQTALAVGRVEHFEALLKHVTKGTQHQHLTMLYMGRSTFYRLVDLFYLKLDERLTNQK